MDKNNGKVCWICDKWFSSGKAIGGHMRSHYVKLPIPHKLETKNQVQGNSANLTQNPIQSASSLTCHPKKNRTQNFRSMKRNLSAFSANSIKGERSVSYPQSPARKRSKCHCKLNATADTKAAKALCMLSEGWPKSCRGDSLARADPQTRFKCDRCGKMFQSYQALGGHKANHSKTKNYAKVVGPYSC